MKEDLAESMDQIKGCHYRVKAATAKIRKLEKQLQTEKEAIEFWKDNIKRITNKGTLVKGGL